MATHRITPGGDGGVFMSNGSGYLPGDILEFEGTFTYVFMNSLLGANGNPIIIRNSSAGVVQLGGFDLHNSRFVKITGSGSSDQYGFKIYGNSHVNNNSVGINISEKSSDIEAERFWVDEHGFGSWCKNEHFCDATLVDWVLNNIHIHHFKMTNLNHHGFYYGATEQINVSRPSNCDDGQHFYNPSRLGNIKIHDGVISDIGKNGVMVNDVRTGQAEIYNMTITNTGNQRQQDQGTGISVGGYSNAYLHNNSIQNTWLWGIASFGATTIRIENNTVDGSGKNGDQTLNWPQNIMINDAGTNPTNGTFTVKNNTLTNPGRDVVNFQVYGTKFTTANVIAGNTGTKNIDTGIVYSTTDTPPPPTRKVLFSGYRTVGKVKKYYKMYTDFTWEWGQ